jgi:ABC-type nitrate/sulfonate/bicarbonate transport system substrate-binding protein
MNLLSLIGRLSRLATLVAAAGVACSAVAAAPDDFSIGAVPGDISSILPIFAEKSGAYKRHNINGHVVMIEGGSRGMQVLLSGKIQAAQSGLATIISANRQGADLRMVSSGANVSLFDVFVTPDIKKPADLKGKVMAVSAFTSETDMAATMALRQWGMKRTDVRVVALGAAPQRMAAQLSGQAAASIYPQPNSEIAREKGLVMMLDMSRQGSPWLFNGIAFQRSYLQSHRDLVNRMLKAHLEGECKALTDPAWAKQVISQVFNTTSPPVIDATYEQWKNSVTRDFTISPAAVKAVIDAMNEVGPPLDSVNPQDYVDYSVVETFKKSGFPEQMKAQCGD